MTKAHCNLIEEDRAKSLATLQVARGKSMAEKVLSAEKAANNGVILIVGSSHILKSVGVPSYLPSAETSIILLRETTANINDLIENETAILPHKATEYDFIWFTPKTEQNSLCDRLSNKEPTDE